VKTRAFYLPRSGYKVFWDSQTLFFKKGFEPPEAMPSRGLGAEPPGRVGGKRTCYSEKPALKPVVQILLPLELPFCTLSVSFADSSPKGRAFVQTPASLPRRGADIGVRGSLPPAGFGAAPQGFYNFFSQQVKRRLPLSDTQSASDLFGYHYTAEVIDPAYNSGRLHNITPIHGFHAPDFFAGGFFYLCKISIS